MKTYECFIASPGDTIEERRICTEVIQEVNRSLGRRLNFRISTWKWEEDALPTFGEDGQDIINKQRGEDYDFFIGIMFNRFGTPTARAESGTEEEFNHAFARFEKGDPVTIMFYFNDLPVKPSTLNETQFSKVQEFKKRVSSKGGLYYVFEGDFDFQKKFREHLTAHILDRLVSEGCISDDSSKEIQEQDYITKLFQSRFDAALVGFDGQPIVWVEPVLSNTKEISFNADKNYEERY